MTTTHPRFRPIAAVVTVALAVAACSGDDDASTTISEMTAPSTTEDPLFTTTTAATPSTTETTVTTAATSTSPPPTESSTTTTASEPTTPDSTAADPEVQAVIDATVATFDALTEVFLDPSDDDRVQAIRNTQRGEALQSALETIEDFRLRGLKTASNTQVPTAIVTSPTKVSVSGTNATIEYCWVNSDPVLEVGAAPDGGDLIIDDSVTVSRDRETYEKIDGAWFKISGIVLETYEETSCDGIL